MKRCECQCHWDRRLPFSTYHGVDVTDTIESATACDSCKWCHYIAPPPPEDGEEGG